MLQWLAFRTAIVLWCIAAAPQCDETDESCTANLGLLQKSLHMQQVNEQANEQESDMRHMMESQLAALTDAQLLELVSHKFRQTDLKAQAKELPKGWVGHIDPQTGRSFYEKTNTGEITFSLPSTETKSMKGIPAIPMQQLLIPGEDTPDACTLCKRKLDSVAGGVAKEVSCRFAKMGASALLPQPCGSCHEVLMRECQTYLAELPHTLKDSLEMDWQFSQVESGPTGEASSAGGTEVQEVHHSPAFGDPNDVRGTGTGLSKIAGDHGCTVDNRCKACVGDCDNDEGCVLGTRCFIRTARQPVPGCDTGDTGDFDGVSFCYKSEILANLTITVPGATRRCTPQTPCLSCQGHCTTDEDCAGDLACFERGYKENVPQCFGVGLNDVSGNNYCYKVGTVGLVKLVFSVTGLSYNKMVDEQFATTRAAMTQAMREVIAAELGEGVTVAGIDVVLHKHILALGVETLIRHSAARNPSDMADDLTSSTTFAQAMEDGIMEVPNKALVEDGEHNIHVTINHAFVFFPPPAIPSNYTIQPLFGAAPPLGTFDTGGAPAPPGAATTCTIVLPVDVIFGWESRESCGDGSIELGEVCKVRCAEGQEPQGWLQYKCIYPTTIFQMNCVAATPCTINLDAHAVLSTQGGCPNGILPYGSTCDIKCGNGYEPSTFIAQRCNVPAQEWNFDCQIDGCNWDCYAKRYPELQGHFGTNAAMLENHYLTHGKAAGLCCQCEEQVQGCNFDTYIERYPDVKLAYGPGNVLAAQCHWNNQGRAEGRCCDGEFQEPGCVWETYLERYPDLQEAFGEGNVLAAECHYRHFGRREGRCCGDVVQDASCDWPAYLQRYPDLQAAYGDDNYLAAACHWETKGRDEGRCCGPRIQVDGCDWAAYLNRWPDLRAAYGDTNEMAAACHYQNHGRSEGRCCKAASAFEADQCNFQCYLNNHAELRAEFGANNVEAAFNHYCTIGKDDGLDCTCG